MPAQQSIRKLSPGEHVDQGYDDNGRLLVSDLPIFTEDDIDRLRDIGVKYYVPRNETDDISGDEMEDGELSSEQILDEKLDELPSEIEKTQALYRETLNKMEDIFFDIHEGEISEDRFDELSPHIEKFVDYVTDSPASVSILAQIENYDEVTFHHSLNICIFGILYGKYRDFTEQQIIDLAFGCLTHDLGKLNIPKKILQKPDDLNDEEWEQIVKHPTDGAQILEDAGAKDLYQRMAYEHHELPDESGYPEGTAKIHPFSRIVSVLDAYEALTAPRPYQSPIAPVQSFQILKDQFYDYPETRRVLNGLIRCLGLFPVGSLVRLSNGEIGVVQKNYEDDLRNPVVSIVYDDQGNEIDDPYLVDLQQIQKQKVMEANKIYDESVQITEIIALEEMPELRESIQNVFKQFGF